MVTYLRPSLVNGLGGSIHIFYEHRCFPITEMICQAAQSKTTFDGSIQNAKYVSWKNVNTASSLCQVLSLFHPLSFILLTPDR